MDRTAIQITFMIVYFLLKHLRIFFVMCEYVKTQFAVNNTQCFLRHRKSHWHTLNRFDGKCNQICSIALFRCMKSAHRFRALKIHRALFFLWETRAFSHYHDQNLTLTFKIIFSVHLRITLGADIRPCLMWNRQPSPLGSAVQNNKFLWFSVCKYMFTFRQFETNIKFRSISTNPPANWTELTQNEQSRMQLISRVKFINIRNISKSIFLAKWEKKLFCYNL